jgi:endonuclease III
VCVSRAPKCEDCVLASLCRHYRVLGKPTQGRLH